MKWKKWAPALLAVVLGGIAAKIARDSMSKNRHVADITPKVVMVAVAGANMTAGHELRPADVVTVAWTTPTPPPDTFTNLPDLYGRVLLAPILKGQTIQGVNLAAKGVPPGITTLIPAGMRAITMNVDEINSISGMVMPGSRVDVACTSQLGKDSSTHTILSDVLVQAVGQRVMPKSDDGKELPPYRTLTLIVTPHDGQLIALAQMSSRVNLMLRGSNRNESMETDPGYVTLADVVGTGDKPVREASDGHPTTQPVDTKVVIAKPAKWTVELIKGGGAPQRLEFEQPRTPINAEADTDVRRAIPGSDDHSEE